DNPCLFFQAEDGIRDFHVTGVQTCALPILDEVRRAIARGELRPGDRLPSQRDLALQARVNPNTVQRAYREMELLNMTETVRGEGTFVAQNPELIRSLRAEMAQEADRKSTRLNSSHVKIS